MSHYPYICRYLESPGRPAQKTYTATCLEDAQAVHADAMPGHRDKVLDWKGPLGWMGLSSIPPQPVTVYTLPSIAGGPVAERMTLDTVSHPVPPGHVLEIRYFTAPDGSALMVSWHALDGKVTEMAVGPDTYGLHHFDTIGHNPFTCDDCPALKTRTTPTT